MFRRAVKTSDTVGESEICATGAPSIRFVPSTSAISSPGALSVIRASPSFKFLAENLSVSRQHRDLSVCPCAYHMVVKRKSVAAYRMI